jgi:hypothetical protein
VISTILGTEQYNLIDAARRARVRCFVPSEFEGSLRSRPRDDPTDRGSAQALEFLERCATARHDRMRYTVFSCGIFYERFAPGGLAAYNIGASLNIQHEGDYLLNIRSYSAEIPQSTANGRSVHLTLTSVYDVARYVAAAIDLGIDNWPREFRVRGAYLTPQRLVEVCQDVRGGISDGNPRCHVDLLTCL